MSSDEVSQLIALVASQLGIALEPAKALTVLGKRGARTVLEKATREPHALRALISDVVIGETYFFRHAEQMAAMRDVALPDRLAASDPVRILSAGCSSGEEPYSLAMIAREVQAGLPTKKRIDIDGIDASEAALEKARRARYTRWSLRGMPGEMERRWFTAEDATFVLAPTIRDAVTFRRASLLDPLALPASTYDIVFCRNVLIYFTPQALVATVERLSRALVPGGYLFLGHSEILRHAPTGLNVCESHGTFYYRRGEGSRMPYVEPSGDASWFTAIGDSNARVRSLAERASSEHVVRDETREAVKAARAAIAREQYTQAMTALEATDANDAEVALLRAVALTELGETARAAQACEALATTTYTAHASYLLAVGAESAGEPDAAARYARAATEAAPGFAMAHLRYGLLARRLGERDVARRELSRAIASLAADSAERVALHAGGLGRDALVRLAKAELAAVEAG